MTSLSSLLATHLKQTLAPTASPKKTFPTPSPKSPGALADHFESRRPTSCFPHPMPELPRHALDPKGRLTPSPELREALQDAVRRERFRAAGEAFREAVQNRPTRHPAPVPMPTPAPAPAPATGTWAVQPGDTVGDIAWRLMQQGVPGPVEAIAQQIVALNGLENPDLIFAGSTLQVPAAPGTSVPPTPGKGLPGGVPGFPGGSTPAPASGEQYPVPFIEQMNSRGTEDDWNAQSNCGPTTLAMIARGFGLGGGQSDGALINQLARSIGMGAEGTGWTGIEQMAAGLGLEAQTKPGTDVSWIRQQLEAGQLVAANGDRAVTLACEQPPHRSGHATGGHWIAVTGLTPEGNFLVRDPSTTCRELTPAQLQQFLGANSNGGFATAIQPPPGVKPSPPAGGSAQGQRLESLRLAPGAKSLAETGFAGQGETLLRLAEKYDVPIDLALGMLWKESCWGSEGLSSQYNNPGNLKFVGQPGATEAFTSPGAAGSFAGWPTLEQGLEAYFRLLGEHYRGFIDAGDWQGLVNRYAPPSENNSTQYLQQVTDYAATVRRHLGLA